MKHQLHQTLNTVFARRVQELHLVGFRSLIRLIRSGVLRLQQHEVIGPKVVVMKPNEEKASKAGLFF